MRLLRLKIRNIASLKGEHEIDFLEIQKHSSLFAITGETGSGKSTVLNSIGLALFGQVYKKNVTQNDVVTLGEKDGTIELIFQVQGKYFLADWRARVLKQNGEPYSTPQSPVRNLYQMEGPHFNSPRIIAKEIASDLLNLDFDQFCKCVILNQGEFAKFLNSSFTERKDILEKLYPGELLESMGRELKLELDALEKSKNELEIKLGDLQGDASFGATLKDEIKHLEVELKQAEQDQNYFEKLEYHFIGLISNFEKHQKNEKSKEIIRRDIGLETTRFNHLLKAGEVIFEKYQSLQKILEQESPKLQIFIQKEENLKNLKTALISLGDKIRKKNSDKEDIEKKLNSRETAELGSLQKVQESKNLLKSDFSLLTQHKENCEKLIELFHETGPLKSEIKGKEERFSQVESFGKDLKTQLDDLNGNLRKIPTDIKEREEELKIIKLDILKKEELKQKATFGCEELEKQIKMIETDLHDLETKVSALNGVILKTQEELFPLETTLKLQEVLNAAAICLSHAEQTSSDVCPVCEGPVSKTQWSELKTKVQTKDLDGMRLNLQLGQKRLYRAQEEFELTKVKLEKENQLFILKKKEKTNLESIKNQVISPVAEIEKELTRLTKLSSERDYLKKDIELKNSEIQKVRIQFTALRDEMNKLKEARSLKENALIHIKENLGPLILNIDDASIKELGQELKTLGLVQKSEVDAREAKREKDFLNEQLETLRKSLDSDRLEENEFLKNRNILAEEITLELKGEKASELIQKLNLSVKTATDEWSKHQNEQKNLEKNLKELQGRLYPLEELTKEYEVQFSNELKTIRDLALHDFQKEGPKILAERLRVLNLGVTSSQELFSPLKDVIQSEKDLARKEANEIRMNLASVSTKLVEWEKVQDKIQLLTLQNKDIKDSLSRKMRLFEVLGRDELRTFVLSLVEESLIEQTNDELQKLCLGRYQIVHQTRSLKMTPEFYILDKYREDGKRKVSTLSGGETFMVSLAMALALAEMTRGQAEIDSLFIDEGFGTLDQECLEDVLDMLQQIQTRGLMVGVISHIKTLTNAIPVNLVLNKKHDGVSNVSLIFN